MKTYENLRGKRADVRGRQVRANKILFSSPWLALIPFTALLLPASQPLYPFLPREISRVYVSIFICSFIVARKKNQKARKILELLPVEVSIAETNSGKEIVKSRQTYRFRLFAFQLADSYSEDTLIS